MATSWARPFGRETRDQRSGLTPEGVIKKQICQWLERTNCLFWVQHTSHIRGRTNNSKYARNGVSDILGIWKNKPLAIEVKAENGKVSPEQEIFINDFNKYGGIAFVAYSLEDVIKKLGTIQDE